MYDIDNWQEEMDTYLGADDPKYKRKEAFTIFEIADLFYNFQPDPSDDPLLEERKMEYYGKIREFEERLKISIARKDFKSEGIGEINNITYLSRETILLWFEHIGEDCPEVLKPIYDRKPIPNYLKPGHDDFCPELQLALDVCEAIYVNRSRPSSSSISERIRKFLDKNYETLEGNNLATAFVDRIRAVCNAKESSFKIKAKE